MTLLIAWLAFPAVLVALSLGCGLLLARAANVALPGPLLLPAGFAVLALATQFAHLSDRTAGLVTPTAVALAVAGFGLSLPWRRPAVDPWPVATALAVFAIFAAPVVVTGQATFLGYIKLDDTATYLAMLDRAMHFGYDAAGLGPSTYEATLKTSYTYGYPLGSLEPLGVGAELVGRDAAWLWQPYIAFLGTLIAVGLYELVADLLRSRPMRALVAFGGAQAALIYGYAMWGGIKELSTAAVAVLAAGLVPVTITSRAGPRAAVPLAAVSAALLTMLTVEGAVWLVVPALAAAALVWQRTGLRATARLSAVFLVGVGLFGIPAYVAARLWLGHSAGFQSTGEFGNLIRPLSWIQVFGIWLNGDFRVAAPDMSVTDVLVALVAVGAVGSLVVAWRRRAWGVLVAAATVAFGSAVYVSKGSPWIGGKALASSSPVVLALGLAGAAIVVESGRRLEGGALAALLLAGVLWSNALQYHQVDVAPRPRLAELQTIGHRFAGQGPTLLTEYDAYGARHFLRTMQTEGASELRRHFVYLRAGGVAVTGSSPDVDEIRLPDLLYYRTLVVRRSGLSSRPPSTYSLVWSGRYYEVWQRPETSSPILEHLSLGSRLQPAAVPACSDVLRLARLASSRGGLLATVERPPAIVIDPSGAVGTPTSFGRYGEVPGALYPSGALSIDARFTTPAAGVYGIWVGGVFRSVVSVSVDGRPVGSARNILEWPGNFVELGEVRLGAGEHTFRLEYAKPDPLLPGSGGTPPFGLGPFAVAAGTQDRRVTYVEPARARTLCGKSLDWLEALSGR